MTKQRKKFWSFRNDAPSGTGQLYLYGPIDSETWWGDEITPQQFRDDLQALGDISTLDVYINSPGGDVFAGQAIHSMLQRHPAQVTVHVDGLAASIASVIAMAGDKVVMPSNSMLMIHNPSSFLFGGYDAADMRKMADDLDAIRGSLIAAYQNKVDMSNDDIISMMDAETWLTAEEAVQYGFADEIEQSKAVSASVRNGRFVVNDIEMDLSRYRNVPTKVFKNDAVVGDGDNDDDDHAAPMFTVGQGVTLVVPPRVPGQSSGEVREAVLTYVYGVVFEGMESDGPYHWYTESELKPTNPDDIQDDPPGSEPPEPKPGGTSAESPNRTLSLLEMRLKHNERRSNV